VQVLLRLDSAQLEGAVQRAEAALSQAEAQETNQHTNELRAQRDYDRLVALRATLCW
jgi:multidrug resistance efflux pump